MLTEPDDLDLEEGVGLHEEDGGPEPDGFDPDSDYDGEDEEGAISPDEVAAFLQAHGYAVEKPGAAAQVAPQSGAQWGYEQQFSALRDYYGDLYAGALDDTERFGIQADFQRDVNRLQMNAIEHHTARAEAAAHLPAVEVEFERHGLPKEAAREYVGLIADLPPDFRAQTEAQGAALAMAVGRAHLARGRRAGGRDPRGVHLPTGESAIPAGRPSSSGLSAKELSVLKRTFPAVDFTPAKIAQLRKEGII